MTEHFDSLKNLIDENGIFIGNAESKKASIQAVEELAESLLGATLCIRGSRFIIRMLEIYYGGIGDDAHDWYRTHFVYKTSKYKEQTNVQNKQGFRVYLSSMDVNDAYTRFDIVVGHKGVPVSFLIRSVWNSDFEIIGAKKGSPNTILKAMKLKEDDHDKVIGVDDRNYEIYIENTSDKIREQKGLITKKQERINLKSDFEKDNGVLWNFLLENNM